MIVIKLTGGLGNQMFQYAYGRSESIRKKQPLSYYFIHHRGDTNRQYELNVFNIKGKKIDGFYSEIFLKVGHILKLSYPHIISGYWQSEKYFIKHENEIRKDFQFKKPLDKKNKKVLEQIKNTNSVSIHIRRGDYVSNKKTNQFHGVCSLSYYKEAINYFKKRIENPKFFVFSDDPEWVKENLKKEGAIYINWNKGEDSYKDIQLMSRCKHNIIANSSFSWWGAWLNDNLEKMVIAPKKWFNDKEAQIKAGGEIVPKTWIKI